jgi:hypothetical protein
MESINFFPVEHTGAFTAWHLVGLVCLCAVQLSLSVFCTHVLLFLCILSGLLFKKCLPGFAGKLVAAWLYRRKVFRDQQW